MKEWRVIIILLSIIVLFSVILGIKIWNNTPEKQTEKLIGKHQESIEKEENNGQFSFDYFFDEEETETAWLENFIATPFGVILCIIVIILMYVGNIQVYTKLFISPRLIGINTKSVAAIVLSALLTVVPILGIISIIIPAISILSLITFIVTSIILEYNLFKKLETSFLFILLVFIPVVGTIILNIILGIRLANKFERGIIFKIGLCIMPQVFRPILGLIG